MAEWLCSGLQIRPGRFDSDSRLFFASSILAMTRLFARVNVVIRCSSVGRASGC